MMRILLYNEHQESELECKEKIYFRVLIVLNDLCIYDVHFEMHVMSKRNPGDFLIFNALLLVYIGDKSGGNDMKAIGDAATFTLKCKM